jgi:electron transfer flavoprotein beta subunit
MDELRVLVMMRMVRDVVEEIVVAPDGKSLDGEFVRLISNESAEQALEQALILKERHGAAITVLGMDRPGARDALTAAVAKGADRAAILTGVRPRPTTREAAGQLAGSLDGIDGLLPVDLVLIGCQSINDLDGHLVPLVAHQLGMPFIGLVTAVESVEEGVATVLKEFAGGVRGRFEIDLPAVLGIQAAERPLRYVPVAKLRAAQQSCVIEEIASEPREDLDLLPIEALAAPQGTEHAEMLAVDPAEAAGQIAEILTARGLV